MSRSDVEQPEVSQCWQRVAELETELTEARSHLVMLQQECDRLRQSETKYRQAQLLSTIAQVANLLLRSPDYTTVLPDVLWLLGEAVGSDRCSILQEMITPAQLLAVKAVAEWNQSDVLSTVEATPEIHEGVILEDWALEFHARYVQGAIVNLLVEELPAPAREFFGRQGTTSLLIVPIMVQGWYWGQIGFDNCGEPRLYDEAEIAILRIAADSIAAAIERQAKDDEL
jgi:GAF domain-containing protein